VNAFAAAADKGVDGWEGQIDMDRWEQIKAAGGLKWTASFGKLWIVTVNLAIDEFTQWQ
jgi:hypothetical protein